ncbi:MAG: glycosyl transferase family 2 [Oscillospiraceae bacterium]|nr:glycosyl transferase family 2 [Oscillospiraceae bacterium]
MKIVVYAICKNEAQFVDRWMDSMLEADQVVVLDTGSSDGTPVRLRARGAQVTEEVISPWRFDTARNRSLDLVPEDADLCVCTDLDEFFQPGWRQALEQVWTPEIRQLRYRYTWNFNPDGSEGYVFWIEKIHTRQGFRWVNPVHEVLEWSGDGPCMSRFAEGVRLEHHADPSKSRGQYLPLLELAVSENPHNDRNTHYLGREYFFHEDWDNCIRVLKLHIAMPEASWADERSASMRYLARSYAHKGDDGQARHWFHRGIAEAPHLREPFLDFASYLAGQKDWDGVAWLAREALKRTERPRSYICEGDAWNDLPYDLLALGCYYTGRYGEALEAGRRAAELAPYKQRLTENLAFYQQAMA